MHKYSVAVVSWDLVTLLPTKSVAKTNLVRVCTGPSTLHGRGLFAARALSPGTVTAFYPAHALGDTDRRFEADEAGRDQFGGTGHKPYRVALPASPGLVAWGADDLWIDADASDACCLDGWSAQLINDAANVASAECTEEEVLEYYTAASVPHPNARMRHDRAQSMCHHESPS